MLINLKYSCGFLMLMIILTIPACKFYSFTGATISPDIQTYSISQFEDLTLINPNYSQLLTQKLIDKLASETNLSPVSRDGDVEFSGQVTSYRISAVASSGGDISAQDELRIRVKVNFVNNVESDGGWSSDFSSFSNYDRTVNFDDVEDQLIEEINDFLVNDIFNKAFVNW